MTNPASPWKAGDELGYQVYREHKVTVDELTLEVLNLVEAHYSASKIAGNEIHATLISLGWQLLSLAIETVVDDLPPTRQVEAIHGARVLITEMMDAHFTSPKEEQE